MSRGLATHHPGSDRASLPVPRVWTSVAPRHYCGGRAAGEAVADGSAVGVEGIVVQHLTRGQGRRGTRRRLGPRQQRDPRPRWGQAHWRSQRRGHPVPTRSRLRQPSQTAIHAGMAGRGRDPKYDWCPAGLPSD